MMMAEASHTMKGTVRKESWYPHAPEKVWVAITDPRAVAEWLMPNTMRAEKGAKFRFQVDQMPMMKKMKGVTECEVLECDPPTRFVYSWQIIWSDASAPPHGPMVISWDLTPETRDGVAGTRLVFEHRGIENIPWLYRFMMSAGWGRMVRTLIPKVAANVSDTGEFTPGVIALKKRCYGVKTVPDDVVY